MKSSIWATRKQCMIHDNHSKISYSLATLYMYIYNTLPRKDSSLPLAGVSPFDDPLGAVYGRQ